MCITIIFILCNILVVSANEKNNNVVRVGFPIQDGMSYIDENGNYTGYLVDYLNQMNLFTNWEIEYVQVEGDLNTQLETLMYMLTNGEIDILGTMNKNDDLEEIFLYPTYSYGTAHTVLSVNESNYKWFGEDFDNWNGISIGTCPEYKQKIKDFSYYAKINNFTYNLVEYSNYYDMVDAVKKGEVDAILQTDISQEYELRTIGKFSPSPYYFAVNKEKPYIVQQLNSAMSSLLEFGPNLDTELYKRYFEKEYTFIPTQEQIENIKSLGTLKILIINGGAPFQYVNSDGDVCGLAVENIENFAELTGMDYEYIVVESYEEGIELIKEGAVNLVACISTDLTASSMINVRLSNPFYDSFSITAYNNLSRYSHNNDKLSYRQNTELQLKKILENKNYAVRVEYYSLQYYLRKKEIYNNISIDYTNNAKDVSYSIGITNSTPDWFINVVNQYINSMNYQKQKALFYKYMTEPIDYTIGELLYTYCWPITWFTLILILEVFIIILRHKNKEVSKRAIQLERYDAMTGAYNHEYFIKILESICQNKENKALVAFNIKNFKYINEKFTVTVANHFLCQIKSILDEYLHDGEYFCRVSADNFRLVLDESTEEGVLQRMNDICKSIQIKSDEILNGYIVTIYSGGVLLSLYPKPFSAFEKDSFAMVALMKAKQTNEKKIYMYNRKIYEEGKTRHYIESHMQFALDNQEFKMFLQPKVDLQTKKVVSAEALVRWQSEDGTTVYPDQFIPLFEENGFCIELDLYMVEQACKQLREWIDKGIEPISISVNQIKLLFSYNDYVEVLQDLTDYYNVPPKYITLEILESLAIKDINSLNKIISKLRDIGFRISLDDFGTGYSSLSILGDLKIDELKLDRAFMVLAKKNKTGNHYAILRSIIDMAKHIGVKTVAEGVETQDSEEMLLELSCDYGQGYYYSKPIPACEFSDKYFS